ncbi:MAG: DNA polymerase III subunit delta' [Alphaproteobacteria bacterium]
MSAAGTFISADDTIAPRQNPDLVGHDAACALLAKSFASGRMPHAWLIAGPRGIGKATLAYRFARYVLAAGSKASAPAETAPSLFGDAAPAPQIAPAAADNLALSPSHPIFRRVASAGHPDLLTVECTPHPKTGKMRDEIGVDDARGIAPFLRLTAWESGWRVVVVDAIDEMNRDAANAVLKILEEPPARVLLLLVCHAPGRLLPTIRSRCQTLHLSPLEPETMFGLLRTRLPESDETELRGLAELSDGSPGRALALAEAGGLELYGKLIELLRNLPQLDDQAVIGFADTFARATAADEYETLKNLLSWWLARLVRRMAGQQGPKEGAHWATLAPGEAELAVRLSGRGGLDRWAELWDKSARLFARADAVNLDRKQALLEAFFAIQRTARA